MPRLRITNTDIVDHVSSSLETINRVDLAKIHDMLRALHYAAAARIAQLDAVCDKAAGHFDSEPGEFAAALEHWQTEQRNALAKARR